MLSTIALIEKYRLPLLHSEDKVDPGYLGHVIAASRLKMRNRDKATEAITDDPVKGECGLSMNAPRPEPRGVRSRSPAGANERGEQFLTTDLQLKRVKSPSAPSPPPSPHAGAALGRRGHPSGAMLPPSRPRNYPLHSGVLQANQAANGSVIIFPVRQSGEVR